MMHPSRAFYALLGLALGCTAVLAAAAARFLRAGAATGAESPESVTWRAVLIPKSSDLFIHLMAYLLLALLAAGLVSGLGRLLVQRLRTGHFLARCGVAGAGGAVPPGGALERVVARAGLGGRVEILLSPRPLAFCHGFRQPRVCLTSGLVAALDEHELEAVLRHEGYHVAYRDPLKLATANMLAAVFFFLPIFAMLRDYYAVAKELAADRHAMRAMGEERSLAAALYKLLALTPAGDVMPVIGATTCLTERVDALLGERVSPRRHFPLAGLLRTMIGAWLLAFPLFAPLTIFTGGAPPFPFPW